MPIDYSTRITEDPGELAALEEALRGEVTCDRIRMLRMFKAGCYTQREVASMLGYSTRQLRRWWKAYDQGGVPSLLAIGTPGGRAERASPAALTALRRAVADGRLRILRDVQGFLRDEFGIAYQSLQGVHDLLTRHGIRLDNRQRTA